MRHAKAFVGFVVVLILITLWSHWRGPGDQVIERAASPDGRYEAVLMLCRTPGEFKRVDLIAAVYEEKGRDCEKRLVDVSSAVTLSHPTDAEDIGASMRWQGGTLLVSSRIERVFGSGNRGYDTAPQIRLQGPIIGAEGI